jgi:hypothetical protein
MFAKSMGSMGSVERSLAIETRYTLPLGKGGSYRPTALRLGALLGKTPKIFPVASIRRKVSGSRPGWRRATSRARSLAAATASAALGKTEVSVSIKMPPLSQTIANNLISCRRSNGREILDGR